MRQYEYMADAEPPASNPVGRPLKFKTVEELDLAIQRYFDEQDPHVVKHMEASGFNERGQTMWTTREIMTEQRPYTMSGLARALGLSRQALLEYSQREKYGDSIQAAKDRCQEYAETQLFGPYANGAKFNLINNYQGKYQPWADKHSVDHTTKDQPIPLLAGLAPSKLDVEDDDAVAEANDSADQDQSA